MTDIYALHDKAFANVSAYVILDAEGARVATITFKHPKDGAGRLWCYLHIFGAPMARGHADGYGYDKCSAAAYAAANKIILGGAHHAQPDPATILAGVIKGEGQRWYDDLRDAGFRVLQAV